MTKKIAVCVFIVLIVLFVVFAALTDESEATLPPLEKGIPRASAGLNASGLEPGSEERIIPEWGRPPRWFRSNAGGMVLEEVRSRAAALRGEYALAVDYAHKDELPETLLPFYEEGKHIVEIRVLYKNGGQIRTQWLFRDEKGTTRLNAVFLEGEESGGQIPAVQIVTELVGEEPWPEEDFEDDDDYDDAGVLAATVLIVNNADEKQTTGFIEIFDENAALICEYGFSGTSGKRRIDYVFNENLLISSTVLVWEENNGGGEYKRSYADFYRYNRSQFLRSVERVFYRDGEISFSDASVSIAFPRRIKDAAMGKFFISERLNTYPEFFGNVFIKANSKLIFETDERSRILRQTLYDENENVIWVINNTWRRDRIVSTSKTEGDIELLAEFEYNSAGDRILERNLRNRVLERLVRTEGKTDIEELYMNNVVVLRAVWEDGRKISETRVRN